MQLVENPYERFKEIYAALYENKSFFSSSSALKFAAITAISCNGEAQEVAHRINAVSEDLRTRSGWFGHMQSPLRFIVSSILILHEDDPSDFLKEAERVSQMFREVNLRRGHVYETMAALIMRLKTQKAPIQQEAINRFQAIYEQMKKYHWWLTGPDDFPACAALSNLDDSPSQIGEAVEENYQALRDKGYSTGDPLQTAANILYLSKLDADVVASRFHKLATLFKEAGVSIWQTDYDELAILSFLNQSSETIVNSVLDYRSQITQLKPKPDVNLSFNLAASITFLDLVRKDEHHKVITDAKALMDMQNIIAAQQAAAAAAASSAAVAASSAS